MAQRNGWKNRIRHAACDRFFVDARAHERVRGERLMARAPPAVQDAPNGWWRRSVIYPSAAVTVEDDAMRDI